MKVNYDTLYNSVNSDATDLQLLKRNIDHAITQYCKHGMCSFRHYFTVLDIGIAIQKLSLGKSWGTIDVLSDSFIYGTDYLFYYISILFNLHGIIPNNLLISTLVPIPKGARVDVCNSDNYRAIALSSIL